MHLTRRDLIGTTAAAAASAALLRPGRARADAPAIKLGVLTDLSGPYKDIGGPLATDCVRLAASEFAAANSGFTVEVIQADHQNKPDVGAGIARQWFDRDGVDVILDVPNSGVALAISGVAKEKNKIFLDTNLEILRAAAAEAADADVEAFANHVMSVFGPREDDVAMIAVRRTGTA